MRSSSMTLANAQVAEWRVEHPCMSPPSMAYSNLHVDAAKSAAEPSGLQTYAPLGLDFHHAMVWNATSEGHTT